MSGYAINTDINQNLEKFYGNPKQQQPQEQAAQEAKVAFAPQEHRN